MEEELELVLRLDLEARFDVDLEEVEVSDSLVEGEEEGGEELLMFSDDGVLLEIVWEVLGNMVLFAITVLEPEEL